MKTREELLAMADKLIALADANPNELAYISAMSSLAQACVMLAKELREDEEAPDYDQMQVIVNCLMSLTSGEKPQTPKE